MNLSSLRRALGYSAITERPDACFPPLEPGGCNDIDVIRSRELDLYQVRREAGSDGIDMRMG